MKLKLKLLGSIVVISIVIAMVAGYLVYQEEKEPCGRSVWYTFEDYTSHAAWEGVANEESPVFTPDKYMKKPFDFNGYENIKFSDDKLEETRSDDKTETELPLHTGYPYQLFIFKITSENVKSISVKWEGLGRFFYSIPELTGAAVYVWNKTLCNWTEIGGYSNKTGKQIITCSLTNPSDFMDNGFISILAYCKILGGGESTSHLETDYVEVKTVS